MTRLAWVAIGLALAAMISLLMGAIGSMRAWSPAVVRAAPQNVVMVEQPGDWVVASLRRATIANQQEIGPDLDRAAMQVRGPDGSVVTLEPLDFTSSFERPDSAGRLIARFRASTAGPYEITVATPEGFALLGIGRDPVPMMTLMMAISGGMAIVLLGAAAGVGWVAFRTRPGAMGRVH